MSTSHKMSSLIDAHFHAEGTVPFGYRGCSINGENNFTEGVYGTHGIHPWKIKKGYQFIPPTKQMIIGEIGLDRQIQHLPFFNHQHNYLIEALHYAEQLQLPIVLHCVRAIPEITKLLKMHNSLSSYLHGYMGSYEQARSLLKVKPDLFFGFSPRAARSPKTLRCFKRLPIENILIETDSSPDLVILKSTYSCLSDLRGDSEAFIVHQMSVNFHRWLGPLSGPTNP